MKNLDIIFTVRLYGSHISMCDQIPDTKKHTLSISAALRSTPRFYVKLHTRQSLATEITSIR